MMTQLELQFKANAEVFTKDDEKIGEIRRVVIDPQTKTVTHVVVEKGFLLTEDKLVPVDWFDITAEDKVILDVEERETEELPPFEELHYVPWREAQLRGAETEDPQNYAQPYFWYPPAHVNWWSYSGYRAYYGVTDPPYVIVAERNVPEDTIPLKEGASVISADDQHVGDVERVFADPDSARATHVVIARGLIVKDRKLIPTAWIKALGEDRVVLSVDAEFLDQLDNYED